MVQFEDTRSLKKSCWHRTLIPLDTYWSIINKWILIPVYLPRINESRHLSIYWATGKLNSNFSFKLWWLSLTWNSSTRVLEHVKGIFYGHHHIYREIHAYLELLQHFVHLGFCTKLLLIHQSVIWRTLQKLYQSIGYFGVSHGYEIHAKKKFVARSSSIGIRAKLPYRLVGFTVDRYFRIT